MPETKGNETSGKEPAPNSFQVTAPAISMPKGGGAIRGMGEKFAANPVTGTGSMTVPIATSPGRSGFGPQLSLSYDSGAGNGPFGLGWNLSLPSITRKTDKGLPKYQDADESDVFILSGAEDLVPVLIQNANGQWVQEAIPSRTVNGTAYRIKRYRPRIEGLFARIERWTNQTEPKDTFWRSISKDNITTWYGKSDNSRTADPSDTSRVFSWLICQSYDDKGNAIVYEYKREDSQRIFEDQLGQFLAPAHERNRTDDPQDTDKANRTANRYLKRIYYGNREPYLPKLESGKPWSDPPSPGLLGGKPNWYFEVLFDYGEGHYFEEAPDGDGRVFAKPTFALPDTAKWPVRSDPFSTYRAGFEIRTYRLCRRVLMFHHFPDELGTPDCLVRSTDFSYSSNNKLNDARNPIYTFIESVSQSGYVRQANGAYLKKSVPPVEFEYTQPIVQDLVEDVDADSLENLPIGVDGTAYQWTDLHGEGIPGILTEQAGAWFYKRNLSPIGKHPVEFAPLERVATKPNPALAGGAQFMDLAGDGQPDLVMLDGPLPGLYEHDDEESWQPFRPFTARLNRDMRDPNLKFVDLDGDGHADVLITEDDAFVWHNSLAEEGFGPAQWVAHALDEEKGPRVVFADGTQSIYLADLSGDGLTDLVRIRNGEVCYWPNLGYGRFGAKVTMDRAPHFDNPDQFDHKRMRLADIDGSGTTDIIYLHRDGIRLYFNQSGNSWSQPQILGVFPRVDDVVSIVPTDLFGNGTACLVWSSSLPGDSRRQMRYVDLMGGQKPHLLVGTGNNLGAETRVQYAPSTKFYLEDRLAGTPWITRLPFPVHVVERVETYDRISLNRFVTRYRYHHGYFDGIEREFRGFGRVDQIDTEEFAALTQSDHFPVGDNIDVASHVPPVLTKTWFHTGVYLGRDRVSNFFAGLVDDNDRGEYYRELGLTDAQAEQLLLDDTVLPNDWSSEEEREACRALKGSMLRQEIYALDGSDKEAHPYTVTEQNFTLKRLQPKGDNQHTVFFAHPREALSYHYERNPADPRSSHALTLEVDAFGNVLRSMTIAYGRRNPSTDPNLAAEDKYKQTRQRMDGTRRPMITYTLSSYTENDLLPGVQASGHHRAPLPAETRTYELTGFEPAGGVARFSFDEWSRDSFALLESALELSYELPADDTKKQKRLIEHVRTLYRKDDLSAFYHLRKVGAQALPGETYKLALTLSLIAQVFTRKQIGQPDEALLPNPSELLEGKGSDEGGYIAWDGNWWISSGKVFFDSGANTVNPALTAAIELSTARQHFFVPRSVAEAFGQTTIVEYDAYDLLVTRTTDSVGNIVGAANDYRVLQPREVMDPNRNRSASAFDALGMVVATAVMGKQGQPLGDLLEGFSGDLTVANLRAFIADPHAQATSFLGKTTTRIVYDLDRYVRTGQPPFAATLARDTHFEPARNGQTKIQLSFSFSDGLGREIQKKIQAEAGDAPQRQAPVPLPSGDTRPGDLVRDGQGKVSEANAPRRWVGSNRTVFNNKGKPVKQYEPFFSATHLYEREPDVTDTGVSPVLFYDPVERVVATLHPNHTYEKVVFDPWQQTTYDVNDMVGPSINQTGDPRTDPDIKGYVREYFKTQPVNWETWHAQRSGNAMGRSERDAALNAEAHANTPTTAHLDVLGRVFVTLAHNKYVRNGAIVNEKYATRVELDIEGNQRAVRDAIKKGVDPQGNPIVDELGRIVMRYDYDLLGHRIHQASKEAGERWMLSDAVSRPIRAWDSRLFLRRMTYDELRRPTGLYVTENATERLAERTVYGETQGDAANHRGQILQRFDGVGIVTNVSYDFKGNLLRHRSELLPTYKLAVNWLRNPAATDGTFTSSTTFDALNRPLTVTSPDGSIYKPTFNEANLLDKVDVQLRGAGAATAFVTNIKYNAKGQREQIDYGNGATTTYDYDPLTFRLAILKTRRPAAPDVTASQLFRDPVVAQDLRYSYDPVGNITRIEDSALKTIIRGGQNVEPVGAYAYDAIYRLIEAEGREHIVQNAFDFNPPNGDYPFVGHRAHPNDLQALRNYTERYEYDPVGNFEALVHRANGAGWTRRYDYQENSLLEAGKKSNRLTRTTVGNGLNHVEPYTHDAHGNMTSMPHLTAIVWDFKDELQQADLGGGGTAYYVYDGAGQRVRKVIESQNGTRQNERLYLGGFEIYREYNSNGAAIILERESLHILDDKQRIALAETQTIQNGIPVNVPVPLQRYQLGNHLGSSSLELDNDGALIAYEEYHPYGTTSFQAGRSAAEVSLKRYRYTGKERDEESGLGYHEARYYAPWLGRWTKCDPSGIKDGPNVYAFVRGNPVRLVDPQGTQAHTADETSPEVRAAWAAAERANFDEATVTALVEAQDRDFERRGLPLATRQALLERATVRATTSARQWEQGNYGTAVVQGGAGVVESIGLGFGMFGDSLSGTAARMTAFAVAPTVVRGALGRLARLVAGRGAPPPPPAPPSRPPAPPVVEPPGAPPGSPVTAPSPGAPTVAAPEAPGAPARPGLTSSRTGSATTPGAEPAPSSPSGPAARGAAPAGIGEAAVNEIVRNSKGIRAATSALNGAGASQQEVVRALTQVLENSGRNVGAVVAGEGGSQILTGVVSGANQPIVQVAANGLARFGSGTVNLTMDAFGRLVGTVTNIVFP